MNKTSYEKWRKRYYNKKIVDVKKEFSAEHQALLEKLGTPIEDKIYTEYEFECLDMDVISFYKDEEEMDEEELAECKELPDGVSREEYNALLIRIDEINLKYKF